MLILKIKNGLVSKIKMNNNHPIFSAEPVLQKVQSFVTRIIALIIIIYCCFHFFENPIVISLIIAFLLFIFLLPSYNVILVYQDRIEFGVRHILINKLSKSFCFTVDQIESIDVNLQLPKKTFIAGLLLNSAVFNLSHWNELKLRLKNGKEQVINTKVYKEDIIKALDIIKKISDNKIQVKGY